MQYDAVLCSHWESTITEVCMLLCVVCYCIFSVEFSLLPQAAMASAAWMEVSETPLSSTPQGSSGSGSGGVSSGSGSGSGICLVDCSDSCGVDVASAEKAVTQFRSAKDGSPACRGYRMERLSPGTVEQSQDQDSSQCHPCFFGYRRDHEQTVNRLLYESRNFQIDSNPKLLLSAGKMVDAIISSGVGHYLEFKSVESLFYVASKSASKKVSVSSSAGEEEAIRSASELLKLWQVPSCKKDIFNTKLFTALEKRALMKLMQFAVDHGRDKDGLPVTTLNENELAQGRALFRPQNKLAVPASKDAVADGSLDEQCFADFLSASTVPARLQVRNCFS